MRSLPYLLGWSPDVPPPPPRLCPQAEPQDRLVGDDTWETHLAACRGVPTTIHLPMKADWLWGPRRDGPSSWYPALELKFV